MTRKQVEEKARTIGVKNLHRQRKDEIIRAVQRAEGHNDCFGRIMDCRIENCCWRPDCQ